LLSFAGESQARNRYSYFASQAKEEGYVQIAANSWTADNEKEHAKIFFKLLEGGEAEITGAFIAGEMFENTKIYPGFASVAESEGFPEIAETFRKIQDLRTLVSAKLKSFKIYFIAYYL